MTLSYRSPHFRRSASAGSPFEGSALTANQPPVLPPEGARGVEWLMAHVVDVIAAGPMYENRLSPVWAQMVRLYAQYLGVIPARRPASRDDRSPSRQRLEKDLRALIPAIADLIEAQEGEEQAEDEAGTLESEMPQPEREPPPSPEDSAAAEAYELAPLARLEDDGMMREALGLRPTPDVLGRVLTLAIDACACRARILRGPLAEVSPKTPDLAYRLARRWHGWILDREASSEARKAPRLADLHPDFFETPEETYIRRFLPHPGAPPH